MMKLTLGVSLTPLLALLVFIAALTELRALELPSRPSSPLTPGQSLSGLLSPGDSRGERPGSRGELSQQ